VVANVFGAKIFVAIAEANLRRRIKNILSKEGYVVVGEGDDSASALRGIRAVSPDLVILDVDLPPAGGMELAKILAEDRVAPIVLLSSTWQRDLVAKAREGWVFSFVVKPINEGHLLAALESAMTSYHRMAALETEMAKLKETLETRKIIERAKGLLMDVQGLSESQAYRRMQQQSMDKSISMRAVAEAIILALGGSTKKNKPPRS